MEGRLRRELEATAKRLVEEHASRIEAAGTLVDIEELTAEIGDELSRQVANLLLEQRSEAVSSESVHCCPDCGAECSVEEDREPVLLQGTRGEIEYQEPRCYCTACRRSFFPSGRSAGAAASRESDSEGS